MFFKTSTQSLSILATYNPTGNISIKASAINEDLGNTFRSHIVEQKDPRFLYAIARAVTADVPNKNKDMFPLEEIKRAYTTFIGRNIFLDHNTKSVRNAVGKIIAAELREDEEGHTYVACLFKIDRELHPDIARKIENGIIDSVSMGANVSSTQCVKCHNVAHSANEFCEHQKNPILYPDYYAINTGVEFTELSLVSVPADPSAKMHKVFDAHTGMTKTAEDAGNPTDMAPLGGQNTKYESDVVEPPLPDAPSEEIFSQQEPVNQVPEHGPVYQIDCASNEAADFIYNILYPYLTKGIEELIITGRGVKVLFDKSVQDPERFISDAAVMFGLVVEKGLGTDKEAAMYDTLHKIAARTEKKEIDLGGLGTVTIATTSKKNEYGATGLKVIIKEDFGGKDSGVDYLKIKDPKTQKAIAEAITKSIPDVTVESSGRGANFFIMPTKEESLTLQSPQVETLAQTLTSSISELTGTPAKRTLTDTEKRDIDKAIAQASSLVEGNDEAGFWEALSPLLTELTAKNTGLASAEDFKSYLTNELSNQDLDKEEGFDLNTAVNDFAGAPQEAKVPQAEEAKPVNLYANNVTNVLEQLKQAKPADPKAFGATLVSALKALNVSNITEVLTHEENEIKNVSTQLYGNDQGYYSAQNAASAKAEPEAAPKDETEPEPAVETPAQAPNVPTEPSEASEDTTPSEKGETTGTEQSEKTEGKYKFTKESVGAFGFLVCRTMYELMKVYGFDTAGYEQARGIIQSKIHASKNSKLAEEAEEAMDTFKDLYSDDIAKGDEDEKAKYVSYLKNTTGFTQEGIETLRDKFAVPHKVLSEIAREYHDVIKEHERLMEEDPEYRKLVDYSNFKPGVDTYEPNKKAEEPAKEAPEAKAETPEEKAKREEQEAKYGPKFRDEAPKADAGKAQQEEAKATKEEAEEMVDKAEETVKQHVKGDPSEKLVGQVLAVGDIRYEVTQADFGEIDPAQLRRELYDYILSNGKYKEVTKPQLKKDLINKAKQFVIDFNGFVNPGSDNGVGQYMVIGAKQVESDAHTTIQLRLTKKGRGNYEYSGSIKDGKLTIDSTGTGENVGDAFVNAVEDLYGKWQSKVVEVSKQTHGDETNKPTDTTEPAAEETESSNTEQKPPQQEYKKSWF